MKANMVREKTGSPMIAKMRVKAVDYTRRLINSEVIKDLVREMLPREAYLEQQLQEICAECLLHGDEEEHRKFTPFDWEGLDRCRMRYFEQLLQSFIGRPGSEETKLLYSFMKRCEECLRSSIDNNSHSSEPVLELADYARKK